MKVMRKSLALLCAFAMVVAMLAGCGAKKSPAESFFDLYDEVCSVEDREFTLSASIDADEESISVDLSGSNYTSLEQAKINGSFSTSGVSVTIPEILVNGSTVYLNGKQTAQLMELFMGVDVLSDTVGNSYISMVSEEDGADSSTSEELMELISSTGTKVKENILAREDAVTESEDGSYILSLDGAGMVDIGKIILQDMVDQKDAYIAALLKLSPDSETLDQATLEELWDELESSLQEAEDDLSDEDTAALEKTSLTMTISKSKENTYTISVAMEIGGEEPGSISLTGSVTPVSNPDEIAMPEDAISSDELDALLDGLTDTVEDYDYDGYDYDLPDEAWDDHESTATEEDGSVDDLKLTPVDDTISTIIYYSAAGQEIVVPVLNNVDWDGSYITPDLTDITVEDEDITYTINYYSYSKGAFDLDEVVSYYAELFTDEESDSVMQVTGQVQSADGSATAQAFYGTYMSLDVKDIIITVEYGDELAIIDFVVYELDDDSVQAILDYFDLENPIADAV